MLGRLRSCLSGFGNLANQLQDLEGHGPQAHSAARRERADPVMGWRALDAQNTAALLLSAAQNHLEGTARLLEEPIPHFGLLATTRGALENAARAWWLNQPSLDVRTRVARGFAERLSSLNEQADVEKLMVEDGGSTRRLQSNARAEVIWSQAAELGFTPKKTRPWGVVEMPRPGSTALLGEIHESAGRVVYKYLSASVHGTVYAQLQHYQVVGSDDGEREYLMEPDNDFGMVGMAIAITSLTYCLAYDYQVHLFGWQAEEWVSWRTHAMTLFRTLIPPENPPS
ncbi:hypothetical protein BH20ACT23_BH20ACT23_04520 [soil metagenome]